ncbi:sugar phosphate isomerase/epimerase family protein [Methanofollis tationis]|uniref:Sugar phosphate isomerase/epimerase n=1 Tax=Methanofollis tationis TaxID=81417 RepID=A0A7K4HMB0_9EURY|nr:sugar phosphate isomerase/epimerase family protein [Methanofollis tationis]NVO66401.1 sugar phosphate isomerase/epimerase [Methanofollis tationis]
MYGISTYALQTRPLTEALEMISGLTGYAEVMDEGCHFLESSEPLQSYSLRYSIHAPSRSVNIASTLEPIRKASVEVIDDCFAIAAEVGADVVIHPGYFAWEADIERARRQFHRSIEELSGMAQERSIRYYVENMAWEYFLLRTPDELPLPEGPGFALDVGHAHIMGCLPLFLKERIDHFHLHDNDGRSDTHQAVGAGTIDFAAVMEAVGMSGIDPVIEVGSIEGAIESLIVLGQIC